MRISLIVALSMLPMLSLTACDDGGTASGESPTVSTGLPPESSLDTLSDDEIVQICEASRAAAAEAAALVNPCMTVGVMTLAFGGDEASCEAAVSECEAAGGSDANGWEVDEESDDTCDVAYRDDIGSECTATIAEYEACTNASLAAQHEAVQAISCSMEVDMSGATETPQELPIPAECVALEEKGCQLVSE